MTEREILSYGRLNNPHLQTINGSFTELELKYGKYCYVPLASPLIEDLDEITVWFKENARATKKLKQDFASAPNSESYTDPSFDSIDIVMPGVEIKKHNIWERVEQHNFLDVFPHFHEQIMDIFPLYRCDEWRFWSSRRIIPKHRDAFDFRDFPNKFRILIDDENPGPTLQIAEWLTDATEPLSNKHIFTTHIRGQSFSYNNLRVKHYSSFDPSYRKILAIIPSNYIDVKKYDRILEKSIELYKDKCLVSDLTITDYIDI
jgi:hypothetical protein